MLNSAMSTISGLFENTSKHGFQSLNNQDTIKILNELSIIFPKSSTFNIQLPKIVCVGSQSSGKSSLLCGLIGMNILPTGKEMVTRCPLNLQMIRHTSQKAWAEFGTYKINLTLPDPTEHEINLIQEHIKKLTNQYAGNNKNISHKEIVLKIYSPNVPNLSLVDLPGLTLIPCTDKGQPLDIKQQIRTLISSYIKEPDTIIMAVMQARADLETDMALELAKEHDPTSIRTCGILTKIDLMNKDNHVNEYLNDNISVDLQLGYGYYAVNNIKHNSMHTSLQLEKQYFQNHLNYDSVSCNKLGRLNVGEQLSHILIECVKTKIPDIINEIRCNEKRILDETSKLGGSLLTKSIEEKMTCTHMLLSRFCKSVTQGLTEKTGLNHGKYLKNHFIDYRQKIRSIQYQFEDSYIQDIINDCNGNHMNFSVFSIEILEHCIQDPNQKTYTRFIPPSNKLVNDTSIVITNMIDEIINTSELSRFHNMTTFIKTETDIFINSLIDNINKRIEELIETEESYIWTDNIVFNENLQKLFSSNSNQSPYNTINQLINTYMNTVKETMCDQVPKMMMCFLINQFLQHLYTVLFEQLSKHDVDKLLSELPEIEKKRQYYVKQMEQIQQAKTILHI